MTKSKAIVCACEDVKDVELRDAVSAGCRDVVSLQRYTGLGTGPCQGKSCLTLCRMALAAAGVGPDEAGNITLRAPVQPIPLRYLAGHPE